MTLKQFAAILFAIGATLLLVGCFAVVNKAVKVAPLPGNQLGAGDEFALPPFK